MSPFTLLRRIWLPRAVRLVLPTLGGEVILQLKATPIAALVTVNELYGAAGQVFRTTYDFFPPMLLVAVVYFALTFIITRLFNMVERMVPQRR
jgi:polar amino acid transport system permease protein